MCTRWHIGQGLRWLFRRLRARTALRRGIGSATAAVASGAARPGTRGPVTSGARRTRAGTDQAQATPRRVSRRQVESSRNETDASALDRLRFPRAPRLLQFSQKPHLTDLKHAARGRRSRHNRVRDGRAPITCLRRIRRPLALASTIASRRPGAMTAMAASRKKCNTSVAHLVHCLCPLLRSS